MVAKLLDGTPVNVGVYKAYRNAGLSHNQAMAITAEVGRENSFNPSTLFGTHPDPARNKNGNIIRNVGMLSWNQGRDAQVLNYMRNAGVLGQQSQANLNAQAAFSVREMLTGYKGKLRNFLNNPNGSPEQFAQELGRNYIVWAYGQNTIRGKGGGRVPFNWQKHDARRRNYLSSLAGMLGDKSYTPQSGGQVNYQPQVDYVPESQITKLFPHLMKQTKPQVEYVSDEKAAKLFPDLVGQTSQSQVEYVPDDKAATLFPDLVGNQNASQVEYVSDRDAARLFPNLVGS